MKVIIFKIQSLLGMATWKKSWKLNDVNIKFWPKFKIQNWNSFHETKLEKYWTKILIIHLIKN